MITHLDELKSLEARANELRKLGEQPGMEEAAIQEYASFKETLKDDLKKSEKEWRGQIQPWYIASYEYALRNAHSALKCPSQTSPRNPKWAPCVINARSELSYVQPRFEEALRSVKN